MLSTDKVVHYTTSFNPKDTSTTIGCHHAAVKPQLMSDRLVHQCGNVLLPVAMSRTHRHDTILVIYTHNYCWWQRIYRLNVNIAAILRHLRHFSHLSPWKLEQFGQPLVDSHKRIDFVECVKFSVEMLQWLQLAATKRVCMFRFIYIHIILDVKSSSLIDIMHQISQKWINECMNHTGEVFFYKFIAYWVTFPKNSKILYWVPLRTDATVLGIIYFGRSDLFYAFSALTLLAGHPAACKNLHSLILQCFDTVGWVRGRAAQAKNSLQHTLLCCCCDSPAALLLTSVVQVEEVCNLIINKATS